MRRFTSARLLSRLAVLAGVTAIGLFGATSATAGERLGYCLDGEFLNLERGQPSVDPTYDGAVLAWFVQGKGITCDPPPVGWTAVTTAPDEFEIPGNTYAWYRPPAA